MTIGQFASPLAKLHGAIDALQRSWNLAKEDWDDETSRNLDEKHLAPALKELKDIIEATGPLAESMSQARRACEPPHESW